jgi:hypothetical protein
MSAIDSLLNGSLRIFAYSMVVIPIVILALAIILYYYKPLHRLTVGIIATTFGSLGFVIFLSVLLISLYEWSGKVTILSITLVTIELLTLLIGIQSIRKRNTPIKH